MRWEDIVAEIAAQGGYTPNLHPKALKELEGILQRNASTAKMVAAAIIKLCKNPLPHDMGGVGNRLGKRNETGDLRPLLYVKLRDIGIRIVYALSHAVNDKDRNRIDKTVTIVVISKREDMEAYLDALRRKADLPADWPEEWIK
ncbi:MAG: hypothetical protein AB1774_06390 [Bacillota bacterium]